MLDDYMDVARDAADWQRLGPACTVDVFTDHVTGQDALAERLAPYEIIVAERERTPFPAPLLERLPNLRLLVSTGPVNWSIDYAAAAARGIVVCGTEAIQDNTPELTWGLILGLCRRVVAEDRAIRAGRWQTAPGTGLRGKTLGLIGLGRVGAAVAEVGRAFGMEVVAWSANLTEARAREAGARRVDLDALLASSDVVSLHVVLGQRTRGLIGRRELALMRPTAVLINTARGPVVDEAALVEALETGRIAGAGLDVFDVEPLPPDHSFRRLDQVVATPHIGYVTAEQVRLFHRQAIEDIEAFLAGTPIRTLQAPP